MDTRAQITATTLCCLLSLAWHAAGTAFHLQRVGVRLPLKVTVISEMMGERHQAHGVTYVRPLPSPFLFQLLVNMNSLWPQPSSY